MKLSVVIAAYNERENVVPLTERLVRTLDGLGADWELLYVVEGTDGTREVLDAIAGGNRRVKVLYREKPAGLGAAFRRGFAAVRADADFVVTMDADLNHQPEEIPALLAAREAAGADIVVGSRFVHGSSVSGIPLWKEALSASMNATMRVLWGLKTRDKTSGFRVYRTEALRSLSFRNDNFAFLPEMLIDANHRGFSIVEAPIRFTVRVHGVSKMHIARTSRSYLSLLRSRWDGWSLFALVALLGGIGLRVAYTYPVHRYLADADSLLTGMRAFYILHGHTPVFYSGVRIGALESYLHAAVFSLFGASRATITVVPFASSVLALVAFFFLARRLVGRQSACFSLVFFGFPSASYLLWTYMPNGYPETVLLGLTALWAAAECREHPDSTLLPAAFGLAAGLAFWNSIQTLACILPGALLVWQSRRGRTRAAKTYGLVAASFLVGASPWIAYNLLIPLGTFHSNFAARPASGATDVVSNLQRLALVRIPELLVTGDAETGEPPRGGWRAAGAAVTWGLAAAALVLSSRRIPEALRRGRTTARGIAPLFFTALLATAFFVLSAAGSAPGPTARYVLFVFPFLACCLGLLFARISLRSRPVAAAAVCCAAAFNVSTYHFLPTSPRRETMRQAAQADATFVSFLEQHGVRVVVGDYWTAYPVNFLSAERVAGIPTQPEFDYYDYSRRVPAGPQKWAVVAWWPYERDRLAQRTGARGRSLEPAPGIYVFLPEDPMALSDILDRVRRIP
ncbi:MAG: glycosyltransferase [Acidobacteriota bacterium]